MIDDDLSILLVRFEFSNGPLWATPGGGVEADESPEEAIRRELVEEVGMRNVELGPVIWTRTHVFPLSPEFDGQRETFYLVRSQRPMEQPSFSPGELQAEGLTGSRWWTSSELRAADGHRFAPSRLPVLFDALLSKGPPAEPLDAGV